MIKDLAKLANKLDRLGLTKEADVLDSALKKLAREVATTGVEGASYSGGKQTTPGFAGGPTVKFYKAKPKSISEFNAFLGGLISDAAKDPSQTAFSTSVIRNLPSKSDTTWGRNTKAAFKEYAVAAGFPEAGTNWEAFANKSGKYAPSIDGIYRFYDDTIDMVYRELALDKALDRMKVPDEVRAAPILSERSGRGVAMPERGPTYDPMDPLADLLTPEQRGIEPSEPLSNTESPAAAGARDVVPFNEWPLRRRIYNKITGGAGIQVGVEGEKFFSTYTGRIMDKIKEAVSKGPVESAWFSRHPEDVFPDDAVKNNSFNTIYNGPNKNIKDVYEFIQSYIEYIDKAKQYRATR